MDMKRKINVIFSLILVLFIIFPSACAQKDETKEIHYNDIERGSFRLQNFYMRRSGIM